MTGDVAQCRSGFVFFRQSDFYVIETALCFYVLKRKENREYPVETTAFFDFVSINHNLKDLIL